jgi:hypothetical protein
MNAPLDRAARLRLARASAGFKGPAEAVERFRWNYQTYAGHENGNKGISRPGVAARYAKAFNVSESWLLTGEGPGPTAEGIIDDLVSRFEKLPLEKRLEFLGRVLGRDAQ